jgi:DNA modification methylase
MAKINLSEDDLQKLSECINNQTEIPEDLLVKLSPGFFEKLQREGQFNYQKLNKFKIPTIEYAGKRPESVILAQSAITGGAAPLQTVRSFGETKDSEWRNMIVQGDNLQFLKTCYLNQDPLIKNKVKGKVKLIYIDPPFGTESDFDGKEGQSSYSDKIARSEFLEALRERFIYLREIISDDGNLYTHCDWRSVFYLKIILDEIFGNSGGERSGPGFKSDIIWFHQVIGMSRTGGFYFPKSHEYILHYSKSNKSKSIFNFNGPEVRKPFSESLLKSVKKDENGNLYYTRGRTGTNNPWAHDPRFLKTRLDIEKGVLCSDVWDELKSYQVPKIEKQDYPTQKHEKILTRIISSSSKVDDLVLDCFAGSGTTAAVAEKLGRRWVMCDFGKHAIYTMQKRIWNIANSKKLGQDAKKNEKYGQPPQSFSIISAGAYDFSRIMNLRKDKDAYINFVLGLFGITRDEKDYSLKYKLSNIYAEKDNNPVEVYPVWEDDYLRDIKIDEDYLKEIIIATGGRLKGDYYIVTPESCTIITDTTLKNGNNEDVNFKLLKFPYKILEDISRHLQIEEQPSSQEDINKLISSTAFYFNEDIKIDIERITEGFRIKQFKTEILDKSKKRFEGLEGLSMLLIDRNYNGQIFNINSDIYKKEISEEGMVKIENLTENSYLIAIDKHGNESKITKI